MVQITGADLTGTSGDQNRTYTITDSDYAAGSLQITISGTYVYEDIDYSLSSLTITFLNNIWDDQNISVVYTTISLLTPSWLSLADFKNRTKLCGIDDTTLITLLNKAQKRVRDFIFVKRNSTYTTLERDGVFYIKLNLHRMYIQDVPSYDGTVDQNDLNIYELNTVNYEETDKNSNISLFREKYGYIELDTAFPTDAEHELHIEFYLGRYEFSDKFADIQDLQLLMALRSILNDKPMAAAASMSESWSMNGVTFSAGAMNTDTYWGNITIAINKLIFDLQALRIQSRDLVRIDNPYPFRRL